MAKRKKTLTKEVVPINEIKEIALRADELVDKSNVFMQIATRGADAKSLVDFKVFDEIKLAKIAANMPEINRATSTFGKQNSQTTSKLMSLNMISQSPYRRLKQCLAQIERKRGALKENVFKLRKEKLEMERLSYKKEKLLKQFESVNPDNDLMEIQFDIDEINIELQEKAAGIADANVYIEGALKEIGMYQDSYNEIKESHNIADDWDEEDFEKCEIEEHVKTAFLHAIRDFEMTGRLNVGTHEYLEQYGVNPNTASRLVQEYLSNVNDQTNVEEGRFANINILYGFLDEMYNLFKNEYKHAMARTGLKNLISKDYLYLDGNSEYKLAIEEGGDEESIDDPA